MAQPLLIAKGAEELFFLPGMANRHGLVAGATGTGKTVTLQVIAEGLSRIGVPVFAADVKGDLSGISQPGKDSPQSGVLSLIFKVADDNGLLLLDLKDLQSMLQFVGSNTKQYQTQYGNISAASVGAIQRGLVALGEQGGHLFLGEPALNIDDLLQTDSQGRGVVNLLAADKLLRSPQLYATFLLWLLSELFEHLPEAGDLEKPKLVFFFDEAHLLFTDQPAALRTKIEQVVRLIRSKGVGVYFVTQNPTDVPETVLGQLGNRVQHALRAFTPRDQKAVRAAAETFRTNPNLDVATEITQLEVGEALVSFLDERGTPGIVERARILPPRGQIGSISPQQRSALMQNSLVAGTYEQVVDSESAYERLKARAEQQPKLEPTTFPNSSTSETPSRGGGLLGDLGGLLLGTTGPRGGHHDGIVEAMIKSGARSMGSQIGSQLVRGVLGSLLGGSSSRRR